MTNDQHMGDDGMPITMVTWFMVLALIGTDMLINLLEKKKMKTSDGKLAQDRRQFSYTYHIPERRSGHAMAQSDRRLQTDRRHFSYASHLPERRSGADRRLGKDQ